MANSMYGLGRAAFGNAGINWGSDTIDVSLLSSASYTPNLSTDQYYNVISGGAIIAAGVALGTKTNVLGTMGAANTIFSSVTGAQAAYLCIYKNTGSTSTSPLIGLMDTASGLPVTPNGGTITVAWASGNILTLFEGLSDVTVDDILTRFPDAPRDRSEWRDFVLDIVDRFKGVWIHRPHLIPAPQPLLIG